MRSKQLDDMPIEEVLRRCRVAGDGEYWRSVARAKLAEYRRTMPRLARFVDTDWRANLAKWESELVQTAK